MNLLNGWFSEEDTLNFIKKSTPVKNSDLRLYKGEEDSGWVSLYFKYNESDFEVLTTLAAYDLTDLVTFFESIINSEEEVAVFLDNELVSTPLLYINPINNHNIRFLVADCKGARDLSKKNNFAEDYFYLKNYDIRCDTIVEKKKLLKEFYRAIKNIINTCERYEEHIYDIGYTCWKDKLKNIISYIKE